MSEYPHSYDRRYNVHGGMVSSYCDSLEEANILLDYYGPRPKTDYMEGGPGWVDEGYGDWRDTGVEGITEVVRRTERTVPADEVEAARLTDLEEKAIRYLAGLNQPAGLVTTVARQVAAASASLRERKIIGDDGDLTTKGKEIATLYETFDRYRAKDAEEAA